MFKNYLITAFRTLKKNKAYTFINVIGLALGIGCSLVIFKVIQFELSYDKHHPNYESIYRLNRESIYPDRVDKGMGTPHPLGPAVKADYPEIKEVARTFFEEGGQIDIKNENGRIDKFLIEEGIVFTENSFFKIFNVEWIAGDPETALKRPNTVVIASSVARQLFGLTEGKETDAIGRLITFKTDFEITGIVADPPKATNFPFTFFFEYTGQEASNPYFFKGQEWNSTSSSTNTYILPGEDFSPAAFDKKLVGLVEKYYSQEETERRRFVVQPLSTIHFDKEYRAYSRTISKEFIYALGIIGLFLVLTACINFINLATAQAVNRAKEIGIRKAIGGLSHQLVTQFMSEIASITFIAVIISLAISELLFIALEEILGFRLQLDFINDPLSLGFLVLVFILVSFISGFYPSVLLSRMNAILALKSKITTKKNSGGLSLRKGLVVFQFAISQFLIIATLVVAAQMKYFQNKELGFQTDAIIDSYLPDQDEVKRERFRELMLESATIKDISFALSPPLGNSNSNSNFNYAPLESKNSYRANFKVCDEHYFDFYELQLLAGRKLQKGDSNNIVINRQIADLIGFKNNYDSAIGATLQTGWDGDKRIVGVMENFHSQSLEDDIEFVLLIYVPKIFYSFSFKVASLASMEVGLNHFRASWEKVYPEYVIDYEFYDEQLAKNYETEQSISSLLRIFALIAILIGCLGLYGLISFIAINRTKEIGVRKVLGASVINILGLFSKEILVLTSIAFVFASPFAYYLMNSWLESYVFRISIGYSFFVLSFGITLLIALFTISHRSISTAIINPAYTLKDE